MEEEWRTWCITCGEDTTKGECKNIKCKITQFMNKDEIFKITYPIYAITFGIIFGIPLLIIGIGAGIYITIKIKYEQWKT